MKEKYDLTDVTNWSKQSFPDKDKKKKAPMLDMFKRVLPAADTRKKDFYQSLNTEETKGFSPWLVMRYLSSAESANNDIIEHYLIMTNELVNTNFSDLKHCPDLQWKLMSMVGIGQSVKHPYIQPGKGRRTKSNAFRNWLADRNPEFNEQELDLLFRSYTRSHARDILDQFQIKDKDIIAAANDLPV
jgi:hypothetical protein